MTTRRDCLVSILIGLAVIAVLAAIGIPAWQSHVTSSHVDEALKATEAAKLVVMEAATTSGGLARVKASDLAYNSAAVASPFVARVEIADGGNITLTTKGTGASPDPILLLVPSDTGKSNDASPIRWSCSVAAGDPHVIPASCGQGDASSASSAPTPASSMTAVSPGHT